MINIFKTVNGESVVYGIFSDERELAEITVNKKKNKEVHMIDKTHEKPKYVIFDKTKTKNKHLLRRYMKKLKKRLRCKKREIGSLFFFDIFLKI